MPIHKDPPPSLVSKCAVCGKTISRLLMSFFKNRRAFFYQMSLCYVPHIFVHDLVEDYLKNEYEERQTFGVCHSHVVEWTQLTLRNRGLCYVCRLRPPIDPKSHLVVANMDHLQNYALTNYSIPAQITLQKFQSNAMFAPFIICMSHIEKFRISLFNESLQKLSPTISNGSSSVENGSSLTTNGNTQNIWGRSSCQKRSSPSLFSNSYVPKKVMVACVICKEKLYLNACEQFKTIEDFMEQLRMGDMTTEEIKATISEYKLPTDREFQMCQYHMDEILGYTFEDEVFDIDGESESEDDGESMEIEENEEKIEKREGNEEENGEYERLMRSPSNESIEL